MEYGYEIRDSDMPSKMWLIIKREEKTDGFCMDRTELNRLRVVIENYLNFTENLDNAE